LKGTLLKDPYKALKDPYKARLQQHSTRLPLNLQLKIRRGFKWL